MSLKNTVETITHTAVNTAVAAVRDPRGTATKATGLVLDTAGAGIGLVRSRIGGAVEEAPAPAKETTEKVADKVDKVAERAEKAVTEAKEAVPAQKSPATEKAPVAEKAPAGEKAATPKKAPAAKKAAAEPAATEDPRDHIPGPDLAAFPPPAPEDLPEPIVIEAE